MAFRKVNFINSWKKNRFTENTSRVNNIEPISKAAMGENLKECNDFVFIHNFDSGNLGRVEEVPRNRIVPVRDSKTNSIEKPNYEFNIWTRPDCAGTEFENGNRTWFYFGVQCSHTGCLVKLNLINLNKQGKMYSQGMAPVTRTLPGKPQWERIKDKPSFITDDNSCTVSFKYKSPENARATIFFAFTYPFSYIELQMSLSAIDLEHGARSQTPSPDDIYYHRECVCYSLEHRRVDLLTISSYHGITSEREPYLKSLFPDKFDRPFKFGTKKVIFISARVHPGETPSSFVFNGFLNLLLSRNDTVAIALRKHYVFKLIPFLNPDGVARGHYRTDTRGVNLNRVYLSPNLDQHPTIFAARSLIRFYHFGLEKQEDPQQLEEAAQLAENYQFYCRSSTSLVNEIISKPKSKLKSFKNESTSKYPSTIARKTRDGSSSPNPGRQNSPGPQFQREKCRSPSKSIESNAMSKSLADQVGGLHINEPTEHKNFSRNFGKYDVIYASTEVPQISPSGVDIHLSSSNELSGPNPLRNLRDTLKNSIYLLLTRDPKVSSGDESSLENIPMDIRTRLMELCCLKCQKNLTNLEDKLPNLAELLPQLEISGSPDRERLCAGCQMPISVAESDSIESLNQHTEEEIISLNLDSAGDSKCVYSSHEDVTSMGGKDGDKVDMETQVKLQKVSAKKIKSPCSTLKRPKESDSGLFLYIDLHGHASKKGIFMYGNHFDETDSRIECMLLPRIMSLNSLHFHFSSCNFTERNMYLKDRRDGMSREGSGRVAVLKATGLVRSYTLECNYNTGRLVNVLPPSVRDMAVGTTTQHSSLVPPKYNPHIFEEVGKALGASILDLTELHPNSRIPASEHRNLATIKEWLRVHSRSLHPMPNPMSRCRQRSAPPVKITNNISRLPNKSKICELERKVNTFTGQRFDSDISKRPIKACNPQDCSSKNAKRQGANNIKVLSIRPRVSADSTQLMKGKPMGSQRNLAIISLKKPSNVMKMSNNQVATGLSKGKMSNLKRINDEASVCKTIESDQGVSSKVKTVKSVKTTVDAIGNSKDDSKKKRKRNKEGMTKNPLMKPLRRLKLTQYKLGDVSRDKFRIKKKHNVVTSSLVSSNEDILGWDGMRVPTGIEVERISSDMSNLGHTNVRSSTVGGGNKRRGLQKMTHNTGDLKKIRLKTNIG